MPEYIRQIKTRKTHIQHTRQGNKTCCGLKINENFEKEDNPGVWRCDRCISFYNAYHRPNGEPKLN